MRKLLLVAVLTLSFNVFANSNYDFFQTAGWNAISNLNEIDTLTMDRNGLYNSRNLCTYIGSAQVNIKLYYASRDEVLSKRRKRRELSSSSRIL